MTLFRRSKPVEPPKPECDHDWRVAPYPGHKVLDGEGWGRNWQRAIALLVNVDIGIKYERRKLVCAKCHNVSSEARETNVAADWPKP